MSKAKTFENELELGHLGLLSMSSREEYVEEMGSLFETHPDYFFVSAEGASVSGKLIAVKEKYPERFIEVGIAEANSVGIGAGLALSGKTVFLQGFGPFLALRCLDQVHTDIAYMNLPVRIINTHAGLTSGGGPTHYNIMDIAIMRTLPNMTVICPADAVECRKAIRATENIPGPVNIRLTRGVEPLVYTNDDYDFEVGQAITAIEGNDITIIACGSVVALAVSAANGLKEEGISARVIDMHTIKPIDKEIIIKAAKETAGIITVEDHLTVAGLGGAVSEVIAETGIGCRVKRMGIPENEFPPLGDMYELYSHLGFDSNSIKKTAKEMLR